MRVDKSTSRLCPEKAVGKAPDLPYLSGVKPDYVYRRRRIGALFVGAVPAFALYAGIFYLD